MLSSIDVSPLPCPMLRAPRVYTMLRAIPARAAVALALLVLAPAALAVPAVRAQMRLTVTPVMTRGSPSAPVVIVEFSDYQ